MMKMIYKTTLENITPQMLEGFFVDWPNPPHPKNPFETISE